MKKGNGETIYPNPPAIKGNGEIKKGDGEMIRGSPPAIKGYPLMIKGFASRIHPLKVNMY